eukprot:2426831-Amphidinium_carterae.1
MVAQNSPVLIESAAEDLFENVSWTPESLLCRAGALERQGVVQNKTRLVGYKDGYMDINSLLSGDGRAVLFQAYNFNDLDDGEAPQLQKEYFSKLKVNNSLLQPQHEATSNTFNLHISNKGGALPHSHAATLNVLLHGAKRWLLVDPQVRPTSSSSPILGGTAKKLGWRVLVQRRGPHEIQTRHE